MNDSLIFDNQPNPSQVESVFMMNNSTLYNQMPISSSYRRTDNMKLDFQGEAKVIPKVSEYHKLANLVMQRFDDIGLAARHSGEKIDDLVKFTYIDFEKDVISISTDIDL